MQTRGSDMPAIDLGHISKGKGGTVTVDVLGKGAMTDREAIEKIANILSMDDCFEDEKADRIRDRKVSLRSDPL